MTTRVEALGRLGGPVVECGSCWKKILEPQAFYLRRLWISVNNEEQRSERVMFFACSRECAVQLEAKARVAMEADEQFRRHDQTRGDSAVWIDDSHLNVDAVTPSSAPDSQDR